jgi:hypothetical protein
MAIPDIYPIERHQWRWYGCNDCLKTGKGAEMPNHISSRLHYWKMFCLTKFMPGNFYF